MWPFKKKETKEVKLYTHHEDWHVKFKCHCGKSYYYKHFNEIGQTCTKCGCKDKFKEVVMRNVFETESEQASWCDKHFNQRWEEKPDDVCMLGK
jgi:hypothetical protein